MKTYRARHTAETVVELPEGSSMEDIIAAHQAALAANVTAVTTTAVKYTSAKMLAELRRCHAAGIGVPNAPPTPTVSVLSELAETPPAVKAAALNILLDQVAPVLPEPEPEVNEEVIIDPDTGEEIDIDRLFSAVQAEASQSE